MSNDLQWLLLRKNNAFIVKRGPEGHVFSKEPGNLRNLHSFKFSGLANSKAINVTDTVNGIQITTRKSKASPNHVANASFLKYVRPSSGSRRALGIAISTTKRGYRPDLRTALLARVSALTAARKVQRERPAKKARGKKAQVAEKSA